MIRKLGISVFLITLSFSLPTIAKSKKDLRPPSAADLSTFTGSFKAKCSYRNYQGTEQKTDLDVVLNIVDGSFECGQRYTKNKEKINCIEVRGSGKFDSFSSSFSRTLCNCPKWTDEKGGIRLVAGDHGSSKSSLLLDGNKSVLEFKSHAGYAARFLGIKVSGDSSDTKVQLTKLSEGAMSYEEDYVEKDHGTYVTHRTCHFTPLTTVKVDEEKVRTTVDSTVQYHLPQATNTGLRQ